MRRPTLLLAAVVAVAVGVYAGYRMLSSDKTRILWLLEDAASSFNQTRLRGCLEAFDQNYHDTTTGWERADLANALRILFLRDLDPGTKAFLYRVLLPAEEITIQVDEDGQHAEASFKLDLQARRNEGWQSRWELLVTASLQKTDGDWRIRRSFHETVAGKPPR